MKVYIETYGCTFNQSDSEAMAGILQEAGYSVVDNEADSDVVIVNSCVVKKPTEDKIIHRVKEITKPKVIAGCFPQARYKGLDQISQLGTHQVQNVVHVVEETLRGNVVKALKKQDGGRVALPKIRKNPFVEIIPINKGCLGACTFCITKVARGRVYSYSIEDIVKVAEDAVKEGVKELWLTSQDCGAYGKDIGTDLPSLLKEVIGIPGDFKIRVGMANPNHILRFIDELAEVMNHEKVFKFLHLPIQAGNDRVLELMKREYTVEEFRDCHNQLKAKIPHLTTSTDIIVGFPGETEAEFEDTVKCSEEFQFDVSNISRYWKRPGTVAAKMEDLPDMTIKARSGKLAALQKEICLAQNKNWIGWSGEVFISEKGTVEGTWIGKNFAYKQVVVKSDENLLGKTISVKVEDAKQHDLRGVILPSTQL